MTPYANIYYYTDAKKSNQRIKNNQKYIAIFYTEQLEYQYLYNKHNKRVPVYESCNVHRIIFKKPLSLLCALFYNPIM